MPSSVSRDPVSGGAGILYPIVGLGVVNVGLTVQIGRARLTPSRGVRDTWNPTYDYSDRETA